MKKKRNCGWPKGREVCYKWLFFMKLWGIFMLGICITAHADVLSQQTKVTLNVSKTPLYEVLEELGRQTQCDFFYNYSLIKTKGNVEVNVANKELVQVLEGLLPALGLEFTFDNQVVVIREKTPPQQNRELRITGKVTGENSNPLTGVTVRVKGLTLGTSTDREGRYQLTLPRMDDITLVFTFIGMNTLEVKYTGQDSVNVVMKESVSLLDEVVISTGYQHIDPRKTTSAIQSIKAEDIVVPGLTSIDQMLEGHIPGMVFMQNSGQIGAAPRLRIRGTSTILASQEPLWVIDGIVQENPVDIDPSQINDLDFVNLLGNAITGLNPEDISQIDILKDASATALYGARAANGVILVTTKQGKQGPPALSYSISGTLMQRPHYGDATVNMMNSVDRIAFSRELVEKRVPYPQVKAWMGYEKPLNDYWMGQISFDEMQQIVSEYEAVNTDWFKILMQNSFSHKHTLNLSGGTSALRYYVSAALNDSRGNIKGEKLQQYTANIKLNANYNRWSFRFNFNGNVDHKNYSPSDIEVTKYAYETTRALPAFNEDGTLWFYDRDARSGDTVDEYFRPFNVLHEMNHSSLNIRSSGLTVSAVIDFQLNDAFKFSGTASYSINNTTQETWHGEKSFYADKLRQPTRYSADRNLMPFGGELKYQNTERYAYTIRGQVDYNQFADKNEKHLINASVGGEISSNQYYGLAQTYRGYLEERGKKMASIKLEDHPYFAQWKGESADALGVWTDKLTNIVSGYATASYTYNNLYTFNANVRMDASNRFGSKANEKLAPIWSLSARWNTKEDILREVNWVNDLSLRGSFGYQGNMLESESAKLIIEKGGIDPDLEVYESSVSSYPNPNLQWEKTSSYNLTMDFALLRNRVGGNFSYFYKNTQNAFLSKTISSVNGMSSWVVNEGELENQGVELTLRLTLIDSKSMNPNGFRWVMTTNYGNVTNKVRGREKDKTSVNDIGYAGLLSGSYIIEERPLNSFYSYKYQGLSPSNGIPVFYGSSRVQHLNYERTDLLRKYETMELTDIFMDMLTYSGTRVPTLQGGIQHSLAWKRLSMSLNMTYSLGAKIRLLQMYPNVNSSFNTIAPQPASNVRKEFLKRWRNPGDELHTDIPGIVSATAYEQTMSGRMWWVTDEALSVNGESVRLARDLWSMYDNSDLRTVSGDFLKIQSLSFRYNFTDQLCHRLKIKSAYVGLSGTNLHTFCHKRLKGQDPATQSGTAPTINLSLRPNYSFNLNVSF